MSGFPYPKWGAAGAHMNELAGLSIVIVDDDEPVRQALVLLAQTFNWIAIAYSSGESFLQALPTLNVQCVLLDLELEGMSGIDVLETLAMNECTIPVLVMTAQLQGHASASRVARTRARGILWKPFSDTELLKSVQLAVQ